MDSSFYKDINTCHLALHLILKANHKNNKIIWNNQEIEIKRGQLVTGRKQLAEETGLTPQSARTSLKKLKNCKFLTSTSTNKFSLITILNYEFYQSQATSTSTNRATSKQPASNQQLTTNNNDKNVRMIRSNIINGQDIGSRFIGTKTTYKEFEAIFYKEYRLKYGERPLKMVMRIRQGMEEDFEQILQHNPEKIEGFIGCYLNKFIEEKFGHNLTGFIYNFSNIVRLTPKYLKEKQEDEEMKKAIKEVKDG